MDIQRISTGVNAPVRPAGQRRGGFEATVSDQGVTLGRQGAAAVQVTSTPSLQKVLSSEEIQALIRQFAAGSAPAAAPERGRAGVYSGRGVSLEAPQGKLQGRLVDLVG